MRSAFSEPDPREGLDAVIDVFCRLYRSERSLLRRLGAPAALDPEVDRAMTERAGWRREGLARLVTRQSIDRRADDVVDLLHALASFETYDMLAAAQRNRGQVASLLQRAVRGLSAAEGVTVRMTQQQRAASMEAAGRTAEFRERRAP